MVSKYISKITKDNGKTYPWTKVPNYWRQDVCDELEAKGYKLNEDGTVIPPAPVEAA